MYTNEITTYYDKFCVTTDENIDVLIIQYYDCIFEYKAFYKQFNKIFNYQRRNLTKQQQDKLDNMECEKYNNCLDTVNLDILIRQLGAIMKLYYDLI